MSAWYSLTRLLGTLRVALEAISSNAPSLYVCLVVEAIVTSDNDEQELNAYCPMLVTVFGIVIDVTDEQKPKAPRPMLVTLFGMVIDVKEVHKAGMKIFLTMNHYAVPLYLVEHYGGWTNRKLIEFYERFATVVFEN